MKRGRTFYSPSAPSKVKKARTGDYMPEALVIGAQQARLSMPIARARPGEVKYVDYGSDSTGAGDGRILVPSVASATSWAGCEIDPTNTTDCLCMGAIGQGNSYFQRIGRRVTAKKLRIRGELYVPFQNNQTSADDAGLVRLILYQDKQTGGVQAQAEEVIGINSSQMDTQNALTLFYFQNPANFGRFRVIFDKVYKLTPPPISYDGTNVEQAGYSIPFKISVSLNVPINFNTTTSGTVADIVDNSFHMIAATNSGLNVSISYMARMVFEDA